MALAHQYLGDAKEKANEAYSHNYMPPGGSLADTAI